ncbi:hypothetical protein TNCT_196351 [Trichonephila clavata]|uniref:Uncharacterized protein n=1 Tax=Trichonephila clavata TaxID=2740835 RepID=A0A8X6LUL4_TRICU|nr:hypothetical protein TNCT_196351 [Trichonephila clavata]
MKFEFIDGKDGKTQACLYFAGHRFKIRLQDITQTLTSLDGYLMTRTISRRFFAPGTKSRLTIDIRFRVEDDRRG